MKKIGLIIFESLSATFEFFGAAVAIVSKGLEQVKRVREDLNQESNQTFLRVL